MTGGRCRLPAMTAREQWFEALVHYHVSYLAGTVGERTTARPAALARAADYLRSSLAATGLEPRRQTYAVGGVECENVWLELPGTARPDRVVVVGAHYDSPPGSPGADDNASGTAALLALARALAGVRPERTLRLVGFVNEEPPHYRTATMGSVVFARSCRQARLNVVAMVCLESLGFFADSAGSQSYPPPLGWWPLRRLLPSSGDFVGLVSDLGSCRLLRRVARAFRGGCAVPLEALALPRFVPGIGRSDHWSFWQCGYPALMATDTAPFRNPHYHEPTDTPERVDCRRLARVVAGLEAAVRDLAGAPPAGSAAPGIGA